MYKNFEHFINRLEEENELIRISEYVNPELEITEITDRISKQPNGGKAILFENTGTDFPVLMNGFGSDKRMAMSLGVENLDELVEKINSFIKELTAPKINFSQKLSALGSLKDLASIMPQTVKNGQCQEVILKNPDLDKLPILKCWPDDGGRFITLPVVHTRDPRNNIRNVGMYRMQVFDKNLTGMHWHKHKVGARHYAEYKELKEKIPIAVALGGDPVYTYCATAPLPDNLDEYLLAGFIRNKKVKLVKCITQNIEVPADADIILEGYVDPQEELIWEGPFGDHTGFYSLADYYPKFHVTCITHKKNAIYPATIVGIPPQEDLYIAKATEKIFLPIIQKSVGPEIVDMHLPDAGVAHNFTTIKIKSLYEGQALKVMNSLWGSGQMALNKCMFVTNDSNVDLTNYEDFIRKSLRNFDVEKDTYYTRGPMDVLDHSAEEFTLGSKIGFDFTKKSRETAKNQAFTSEHELDEIKEKYPNIVNISSLHTKEIPIIIFSINKKEKIKATAQQIIDSYDLEYFKIAIFVDEIIEASDYYHVAWIIGNNIAPLRDVYVLKNDNNKVLIVDATKKTKEIDDFQREWPEIITMDSATISKIDSSWKKYNIGNKILSPSLKFIK